MDFVYTATDLVDGSKEVTAYGKSARINAGIDPNRAIMAFVREAFLAQVKLERKPKSLTPVEVQLRNDHRALLYRTFDLLEEVSTQAEAVLILETEFPDSMIKVDKLFQAYFDMLAERGFIETADFDAMKMWLAATGADVAYAL